MAGSGRYIWIPWCCFCLFLIVLRWHCLHYVVIEIKENHTIYVVWILCLAFPEHSISYLFFNKRMTKTFILKITPALMVHCKGHICQLFLLMQLECMGLFATQQWNKILAYCRFTFCSFILHVVIILYHLSGFKSLREQGMCDTITLQ